MTTCYACGEKSHVRAYCQKANAECFMCGETEHISSVCRKLRGSARSGDKDRPDQKQFAGVAFTAWRKEAAGRVCRSLTRGAPNTSRREKSQFASYERLARTERIEGLRELSLNGGVVKIEAVQHGGLWEIVTVKKPRAFVAVKGPAKTGFRFGEEARKPPILAGRKLVEVKPVKYIEVDLDSDDEEEEVHRVDTEMEALKTMSQRKPWEPQRKAWEQGQR
ncbi:hypothetical protein KFL_014350010 [Klebsormidium nitens]|uniref:CCHC-type domain-containing protein n=1 Tax=Klebsormidium nitens TaxID=105231 RepID=A0A1Y1IRL8_KLENI|nr:hypothetical protein KFL_014350010 [Klebsormidium nitens]|eukprot:GAQ93314.1 hypothetical protein KFL_014350010 [Klebsormidium nitens]